MRRRQGGMKTMRVRSPRSAPAHVLSHTAISRHLCSGFAHLTHGGIAGSKPSHEVRGGARIEPEARQLQGRVLSALPRSSGKSARRRRTGGLRQPGGRCARPSATAGRGRFEPWPRLQTQTPTGAWRVTKGAGLRNGCGELGTVRLVYGERRVPAPARCCQRVPRTCDGQMLIFHKKPNLWMLNAGDRARVLRPPLGQSQHLPGDSSGGPTSWQV